MVFKISPTPAPAHSWGTPKKILLSFLPFILITSISKPMALANISAIKDILKVII
jgi:hypothetical protein